MTVIGQYSLSHSLIGQIQKTQQSLAMTEHFHNFQTFMPANKIDLFDT